MKRSDTRVSRTEAARLQNTREMGCQSWLRHWLAAIVYRSFLRRSAGPLVHEESLGRFFTITLNGMGTPKSNATAR